MKEFEHDSRAVANRLLDIARSKGIQLTLMQLIKLVYLAHAWSLTWFSRPMIRHAVQAWQYGPVVPQVYRAFKKYGSAPITDPAIDRQTRGMYVESFTPEEASLLEAVVENYGKMHAFKLSEIMHQPGTPWSRTYEGSGPYSEIPNALIKEHFDEIRQERTPA